VKLRNREAIERFVKYAKGAPENPLTDAELAIKVESLIAPALGAACWREIVACVACLENLADLKSLIRLMTPEKRAAAAA
jgi:hypothetical protein